MTMQYAAPDPSGLPELDIAGMVAALKAAGYSVRKARATTDTAPGRKPARRTGKAHGACIEHWKIDGYAKPVCVLGPRSIEGVSYPAQDREDVLGFAEEVARIAATVGDVLTAVRMRDAARIAAENAAREEQRQRVMRGEAVAA